MRVIMAGGMEGHVSRDCTMEQKAKSCYRCGREGHIVRVVPCVTPLAQLVLKLSKKSRAIALRPGVVPAVVLADTVPVEEEAAQDKNAIAVARWAILRVRAPKRRAVGLEEVGIAEEVEVVEVGMAVSAVGITKRRGTSTTPHEVLPVLNDDILLFSYTCGGVGHLSRDCVQGSKCYNCSGIVRCSASGDLCGVVNEWSRQGHISRDCPQPQRRACYTCGSEG